MTSNKSIVRTIHHLACHGGTLISKCIQAMPQTLVVSEVHPDELRYTFNPYDPVQLLLASTQIGKNKDLRRKLFQQRIQQCLTIAEKTGVNLVFREHTHFDYCASGKKFLSEGGSSLLQVLPQESQPVSLLTVRSPIEAYLSLKENKWDTSIHDFDDYCSRLVLLIESFRRANVPIIKYEDFCASPYTTMRDICAHLKLDYDASFAENFFKTPMTGDSGRGSRQNLASITALDPKPVPSALLLAAKRSYSFAKINAELDY